MSEIKTKRALLCAITAFFWFAQYVYIPFLTPYLMTLSISATIVGVIVGAYGVTQMLLRIPLGILTDIIRNHKLIILVGTFLAGLSSLGMMIFPSPLLLFVSNAISGAASSSWISFTVLYPTYYDKSETTKAIGIMNLIMGAGIMASFIIGGILFEYFGIRGLFTAGFISGMTGFLLAFFIRREPETTRTNVSIQQLVRVMKEKRLLFSTTMCGFMYLILFATVFSFTTSTARDMGATGLQLGLLSVLFSGAAIIGSYFVGTKMAERVGEKNLLVIGFFLLVIYCTGIALSTTIVTFYPLQILAGLANGILASALMAHAIRYIDAERKTTAMGFYQSIYCLGITFGPVVMGLLIDHVSKATSFMAMAAIALACTLAIPSIFRSKLLKPGKVASSD